MRTVSTNAHELIRTNSFVLVCAHPYTLFGSRVKNLFLYYLQNRKAKTLEQAIDLLVSDRIKETLSHACLRHVLSTEGTGWFAPEKLTEVIDTYENSQMYLPGKYSKFSDTGSSVV